MDEIKSNTNHYIHHYRIITPVFFRIIAVYNGKPFGTFSEVLLNIIISVVMTVTISCGVVTVMIWLHKRFSWGKGIFKRLILEATLTLLTVLNILLYFLSLNKTFLEPIYAGLAITVVITFILVAITEGIFFFQQWKQSAVEAEQFKKKVSKCSLKP